MKYPSQPVADYCCTQTYNRVQTRLPGCPGRLFVGWPSPELSFGSSPRAVGAPGAGGSFALADPDARLGDAYVMNKLDFYLEDDPREKLLRDAAYRAISRLT